MNPPKKRIPIPVLTVGALALVGGLWGACYSVVNSLWKKGLIAEVGQFGDSFGMLNTLFAGLAFVGVIITLYKQHVDGVDADERHGESLAAQERITRLQAVSTCFQYQQNAVEKLWLLKFELSEIQANFDIDFRGYGSNEDNFFVWMSDKNFPKRHDLCVKLWRYFGPFDNKKVNEVYKLIKKSLPVQVENLEMKLEGHVKDRDRLLGLIEQLTKDTTDFSSAQL